MKDNTLRLRLTQSEVQQFGIEGKVCSSTCLGLTPESELTYSLVKDKGAEVVKASYKANQITVQVPAKLADNWALTEQVGFEEYMPLDENKQLYILVEKDFKCLQERPHEDESDAFPNPLEKVVK